MPLDTQVVVVALDMNELNQMVVLVVIHLVMLVV
jgi:hypothetical protein